MDFIVSFINLIIVPFVGVVILYRREHRELKATMAVFSDWVLFLVSTMILCHIALALLSKVFGIYIGIQSEQYTIGATVIACLLPYAIQIAREYIRLKINLQFEVKKR